MWLAWGSFWSGIKIGATAPLIELRDQHLYNPRYRLALGVGPTLMRFGRKSYEIVVASDVHDRDASRAVGLVCMGRSRRSARSRRRACGNIHCGQKSWRV